LRWTDGLCAVVENTWDRAKFGRGRLQPCPKGSQEEKIIKTLNLPFNARLNIASGSIKNWHAIEIFHRWWHSKLGNRRAKRIWFIGRGGGGDSKLREYFRASMALYCNYNNENEWTAISFLSLLIEVFSLNSLNDTSARMRINESTIDLRFHFGLVKSKDAIQSDLSVVVISHLWMRVRAKRTQILLRLKISAYWDRGRIWRIDFLSST